MVLSNIVFCGGGGGGRGVNMYHYFLFKAKIWSKTLRHIFNSFMHSRFVL